MPDPKPGRFPLALSLSALAVALSACGILWLASTSVQAADRDAVVVFNANWCASCRDVLPIVREVSQQNGYNVVEIDVDDQRAPSKARQYGLEVPSNDPPQVYFLHNGGISLIFDGRNYQYGKGEDVRARLLQNLQRNLAQPGPAVSGR